jgi:histidine triad (HIT) family protein
LKIKVGRLCHSVKYIILLRYPAAGTDPYRRDPERRYVSVDDFSEKASDAELVAFLRAISRIAEQQGVTDSGYRILANHGAAAHQEVPHFHLHLFGGRDLGPMLRRPR